MVISTGTNMRHRERKWGTFFLVEKLIKISRVGRVTRVGRSGYANQTLSFLRPLGHGRFIHRDNTVPVCNTQKSVNS